MGPEKLWWLSTRLHRKKLTVFAKLIKATNFVLFKTILPFECDIQPDIRLYHRGLTTVVHPRTKIGSKVKIGHGATISGGWQDEGSTLGVLIEDGVFVGAGAILIPRHGKNLTIGAGAVIAAGSVVTDDVPPGARVVGPKARVLEGTKTLNDSPGAAEG
ncbi:hypothetical protein QMA10_06180 [Arthrobacter sp. APC 3897]|uniref:hypothetical protein n=1 Tax=Arthrobacter sp. APC 3897 TaxID=3035204 RepID=UPI0025B359C1|nr:hypothetical protein [Arthrobacter sp. APC 3897]MDN3481509.1 hypothetical protein [Arthrobacter sp. APC 3897]